MLTGAYPLLSPPQVQTVFSSSDSSPQPEKITLEDLTEHLPGTLRWKPRIISEDIVCVCVRV